MGDWKGIRRKVRKHPDAPLELYNLHEDVGETHDVAKDHPGIVARIEQIILEARDPPEVAAFRFGRYRRQAERR